MYFDCQHSKSDKERTVLSTLLRSTENFCPDSRPSLVSGVIAITGCLDISDPKYSLT